MRFLVAVVWGSLSAQFLVQVVACLIISVVYLSGLLFSRVPKVLNAGGTAVSFVQAIIFAALFVGGNWLASDYIDYGSWNTDSIAGVVAFLFTIVYCGVQVPGKVLLARLCAWQPSFFYLVNIEPAHARVAYARAYLKKRNEKAIVAT